MGSAPRPPTEAGREREAPLSRPASFPLDLWVLVDCKFTHAAFRASINLHWSVEQVRLWSIFLKQRAPLAHAAKLRGSSTPGPVVSFQACLFCGGYVTGSGGRGQEEGGGSRTAAVGPLVLLH